MAGTKEYGNALGVENKLKPSVYEFELIQALEAAVDVGLTSENVGDHGYVYDDLCAAAYTFIEKVAMGRYRSSLNSRGIDPSALASLVTEELFFRKLDYVMNSNDPVNCRGLIYSTLDFRFKDLINHDKRAQNDNRVTIPDGDDEHQANADAAYSTANVHFTDVGWNLMASDTDLEGNAIVHDECLAVLNALKRNANTFEVVAFLATKLIGYKASELAEELLRHGKAEVYLSVLQQTSELLGLDSGYFLDAAFEYGSTELKNTAVRKLSADISHGSDRAKNKVRKLMGRSK